MRKQYKGKINLKKPFSKIKDWLVFYSCVIFTYRKSVTKNILLIITLKKISFTDTNLFFYEIIMSKTFMKELARLCILKKYHISIFGIIFQILCPKLFYVAESDNDYIFVVW